MKLQIEDQKLRVRIGEDELARLLEGLAVQCHAELAPALALTCTLSLHDGQARVGGLMGAWQITLPHADVRDLAARLPSRDGLTYRLSAGERALELLFDVDVRDSVRKRHGKGASSEDIAHT